MKKTSYIVIAIIVLILIVGGIYFATRTTKQTVTQSSPSPSVAVTNTVSPSPTPQDNSTVIGKSVSGHDITAYNYGTGSTNLLFIGGIHGGYEWNTSLVAYQLMDYLAQNPSAIPANVKVTVIPVLNPDGLSKVVQTDGRFTADDVSTNQDDAIAGRFNANNIDLNRNFDCDWKATGVWQTKTVSGGSSAFSEPESLAIKNYIASNKPAAAIVWFSSAGGVYSSNCGGTVSSDTAALTKLYATASGYPAHQTFNSYEVSGDMVNWFAKNSIPAISVLLSNHTDTEWFKNQAGIDAVLKQYAE